MLDYNLSLQQKKNNRFCLHYLQNTQTKNARKENYILTKILFKKKEKEKKTDIYVHNAFFIIDFNNDKNIKFI